MAKDYFKNSPPRTGTSRSNSAKKVYARKEQPTQLGDIDTINKMKGDIKMAEYLKDVKKQKAALKKNKGN
jgi:hypothetical protein